MFFIRRAGTASWPRSGSSERSRTAELLRQGRQPSPSFRQAVGRRIIRFGARLAAEPSLESARSR